MTKLQTWVATILNTQHHPALGGLIATLALVAQSTAYASQVPATAFISISCAGGGGSISTDVPENQSCFSSNTFDGQDLVGEVSVNITLDENVSVVTEAVTINEVDNVNPFDSMSTNSVLLDYGYSIVATQAAPIEVDLIPLMLAGSVLVSREGDGSHNGFIGAEDTSGGFIGVSYGSDESQAVFNFTDGYHVGQSYGLAIETFCSVITYDVGTSSCMTTSTIDVAFDQNAFDLMMGGSTFLLSDYFTINYSSNLTQVPIPAAIWLFLSATLFFSAGQKKRRG